MIKAKGLIYGKCWGGGAGAYPAINLEVETPSELVEILRDQKKYLSLDSGMGFEQVIGGVYFLKEEIQEGVWLKTRTLNDMFFGDLSNDQKDFLLSFDY